MVKEIVINIKIDTNKCTPQKVKDLILTLIATCEDNCFEINSVDIDNIRNYTIEKGFTGDMARHFIDKYSYEF